MTEANETTKKANQRGLTGVVASISGDKTIKVVVNRLIKHKQYEKYVRRRSKLSAHDPKHEASVGDVVEIVPCRRLSKSKSWRLARIIRPAVMEAAGSEEG